MNGSILGQNIKRIRETKGLSGTKLAKQAGVGASTISQIENGTRKSLSTATLSKIARVLEVSTQELLFETGKNEFVVEDIKESLQVLLSSDELTLDKIELSASEKNLIELYMNKALSVIRMQRSDLND